MKYKYDVFLSFSGKDIDEVKSVWKTLNESGLKVFFSEETLKKSIGLSFNDGIEEGLEKSKDFLLICTPNSKKSRWVKREMETFYQLYYTESDEKRRFIIYEGKEFDESLLPPTYRILQRSKSVSEIIDILKDEAVQQNDQEMMTHRKKVDETENERKNTLWQIMENRMVKIPAGSLLIKDVDSGIEFTKEIKSFWLDKFPVTQELYEMVMKKKPSLFKGRDRPVEQIKWFDAVEFCNRLSENVGLKRVYTKDRENYMADWEEKGFRLPCEAEWEYACCAGTTGEFYSEIDKYAWHKYNSNETTQVVGKKDPNPWGLYDILGNVWEWCWDCYEKNRGLRKKGSRVTENCTYRVRRGGSWKNRPEDCLPKNPENRARKTAGGSWDNLGFRLARSL